MKRIHGSLLYGHAVMIHLPFHGGDQDSGIGMDSGKIDNVFNPFFTTKQDGLGMGLSINRTIIEAHAGWIRASQNPEGGAIFSFGLPVYKE